MAQLISTRPGELLQTNEDNSPPGTASGSRPEMATAGQSNNADISRAQNSLKARKRTKTGCLSRSPYRVL